MSVDAAYERLVRANPIPDPAVLLDRRPDEAALLTVTQQRSELMAVETEVRRESGTGIAKRRNPALALAAFAVIVVGGLIVRSVVGDDVAASASPVEVAEAFIAAVDTWDDQAAVALFAPEASVNWFVSSPQDLSEPIGWYRAAEWHWILDECTPQISDPGAVDCAISHQNAWMRALGSDPRPIGVELIVADGLITRMSVIPPEFPEWGLFLGYVRAASETDMAVMYENSGTRPSLTPESIALWRQYTDAFVAEQATGG